MMLRAEEFHYSCALSVGSSESELLTFIAISYGLRINQVESARFLGVHIDVNIKSFL